MASRPVDEWSEHIERDFLAQPFVARPSPSEARSKGTEPGNLLIKLLPHPPSRTVAMVVLALSTLTVYYEGLSFRTLQRRTKSKPALPASSFSQPFTQAVAGSSTQPEVDDDQVFAALLQKLTLALEGGDDVQGKSSIWLKCELGRGEASLMLNLEQHSSSGDVFTMSVSFDLAALDRTEGPRFIHRNLLLPMAGMASASSGNEDQQDLGQASDEMNPRQVSNIAASSAMNSRSRVLFEAAGGKISTFDSSSSRTTSTRRQRVDSRSPSPDTAQPRPFGSRSTTLLASSQSSGEDQHTAATKTIPISQKLASISDDDDDDLIMLSKPNDTEEVSTLAAAAAAAEPEPPSSIPPVEKTSPVTRAPSPAASDGSNTASEDEDGYALVARAGSSAPKPPAASSSKSPPNDATTNPAASPAAASASPQSRPVESKQVSPTRWAPSRSPELPSSGQSTAARGGSSSAVTRGKRGTASYTRGLSKRSRI